MTAQEIKSRIDFAKLMKDKIFDPSELVSVEEVRKEVNKEKKILGPRTIEFYARYGLLKKSIRITGDKKAYYKRDYIFDALALILLLKAHYSMPLSTIKNFMKTIKHSPKNVFTDLIQLEDEIKNIARRYKLFEPEVDIWRIGAKYITHILENKRPDMLDLMKLREKYLRDGKRLSEEFKDKMQSEEYEKKLSFLNKQWDKL